MSLADTKPGEEPDRETLRRASPPSLFTIARTERVRWWLSLAPRHGYITKPRWVNLGTVEIRE